MKLADVRALVTGGAGFIGSTLVDRLLAEGAAVDVVDDLSTGSLANLAEARRSGGSFGFHQLDVRAPELDMLIARRRPEVVFHLAAQPSVAASINDPVLDAEVNLVGTVRVLDAARRHGVEKVVFAASGGTLYGEVERAELPVAEHHGHHPSSPYGVSKKIAIDYCVLYRELFGLEFTALALGNVYGPRQKPDGEAGVVAIFAHALERGAPCTIFGDGDQTRDFVFVDDVVDAFARAATKGSGLVINIGTGVETSVNDLYVLLAELHGVRHLALEGPARSGEVRAVALDPTRARLHLGWRPFTPLREGVARALEAAGARTSA